MAATFDYHTSSTERLEGIKATVRSKIYQVFGAPSRAFLALDYANNSVITIGDLVSGLRRCDGRCCVCCVRQCSVA